MDTHWPVASNSKPWKGQTSRTPYICPSAAGPRSEPRCGQTASATQTRPLSSHQTTMFSPIQVFWMSLAFSTLRRLAMKYHPRETGEAEVRSQAPFDRMSSFDTPDAESRGDGFLADQNTLPGCESHLPIPPRVRMRCFRDVTTHPAGQGAHILALPMTLSGVRAQVIHPREHEWRCSRERSTDPHIK